MNTEQPPKTINILLTLHIRANSKYGFVRGEQRARATIERQLLMPLQMQETRAEEYRLTIPYQTNEELNTTINELLQEAEHLADTFDCFTEADAIAQDGSGRHW